MSEEHCGKLLFVNMTYCLIHYCPKEIKLYWLVGQPRFKISSSLATDNHFFFGRQCEKDFNFSIEVRVVALDRTK